MDSERLAVRTEAVVLAEMGWPLSESEIIERFVGRTAEHMLAEVELAVGRRVDWDTEFRARYRAVFDRELRAVEGVVALLDALDGGKVATAVASSSTHDSIRYKFALTGLDGRFGDAVFSCEDVADPKPAPDVYLLAAATLGVDPARCAVVEDSVAGVASGTAAGMSVFAFAGGVTPAERLAAPGVVLFDAMSQLGPRLLGSRA